MENVAKYALFQDLKVRIRPDLEIPYLEGVLKHPGQQHLHFQPWQYYVAPWGRRTGKTIGAAAEGVTALSKEGARVWIVAPTYELTDRVFDYFWKWIVVDKCYGPDSVVKASKTRDRRYIETKWGSFVQGKSAEAPNSLLGEQLDLVIFDECARCPEAIWTECLEPTTLDRRGRVIFISTPRGKNWFFDYFERRNDKETSEKGWNGSKFHSADNPFVDREWLESKRTETPGPDFRREYEASFEDFTGLVWPDFRDRDISLGGHVFDPRVVRVPDGTDYLAIDIGWRHPTAAVWGRVDREGNVYVLQEYLGEPSVVHFEHARNIQVLSSPFKLYDAFISPDAASKHPTSREADETDSPLEVYLDAGLPVRKASDNVLAGISTVGQYFRSALSKNTSHPGVYISIDCRKLRPALGNYIFQEPATRREVDPPQKPRKYKDDLLDAFRYLLAGRPHYALPLREMDFQGGDMSSKLQRGPFILGRS